MLGYVVQASDSISEFDVHGPAVLDLTLNILESYSLFYPVETVGLSQSAVWMDAIKGAVKAFSHWHYVDRKIAGWIDTFGRRSSNMEKRSCTE